MWDTLPPFDRIVKIYKSLFENQQSATKAISEMIVAGAALTFPLGVVPTVVSPLGVVPKPHSDKTRIIFICGVSINTSSRGPSSLRAYRTLPAWPRRLTIQLPTTLTQGITKCLFTRIYIASLALSRRANITKIFASSLVCRPHHGSSLKAFVNWLYFGEQNGKILPF